MGDAKGTSIAGVGGGQHVVVSGYLPNGRGGTHLWSNAHMNGPLPKMRTAMWYEVCHMRWPDAGFGYFLAAMRKPGEEAYLPSLFFGLGAMKPGENQPPSVQSYLAPERGFAFLRMEESPAYWSSPRPAVSQQFGMYYVHYVHDCFSLLGYHAFNRHIYANAWGGGRGGYAGGHAWRDSVRGHAGVVVDNLKARPVDRGNDGMANHSNIRFASYPIAKLSGARAAGVYPNIDLERVIVLTDEYLFDVFALQDTTGWDNAAGKKIKPAQRRYEWMIHGPGSHLPADASAWAATNELNGAALYRPLGERIPDNADVDPNDLTEVRKRDLPQGESWSTDFLQDYLGPDVTKSRNTKAWYDRQIGVRVHMLGEQPTTVFTGRPPVQRTHDETGGFTLMARRHITEPRTTFVAVHEPFEGGPGTTRIASIRRIHEDPTSVHLHIAGKPGSGINDYLFIEYMKDEPTHLFVRVSADKVEAFGNAAGFTVEVTGSPTLHLNGEKTDATIAGGKMTWPKR
jgi:hypothetical protein